jgi:hypothetical protein
MEFRDLLAFMAAARLTANAGRSAKTATANHYPPWSAAGAGLTGLS